MLATLEEDQVDLEAKILDLMDTPVVDQVEEEVVRILDQMDIQVNNQT